jgi:hypothetical protein
MFMGSLELGGRLGNTDQKTTGRRATLVQTRDRGGRYKIGVDVWTRLKLAQDRHPVAPPIEASP